MKHKHIIVFFLLTATLSIVGCQSTTFPKQKPQQELQNNLMEPNKPQEPKTDDTQALKGTNPFNNIPSADQESSASVDSPALPRTDSIKTQPINNKKVPNQPTEPNTPTTPPCISN